MPIYLDYNATCPIKPQVITKVVEVMSAVGNPSSQHKFGRDARMFVERGREAIADRLAVAPSSVVFTGSGTEADNLALMQSGSALVLISGVEHPALLQLVQPEQVVPVQSDGTVNLSALSDRLSSAPRGLLSVQMVNSETGIIQPIEEIAKLTKQHGWFLHTDAVQAFGKLDFDFESVGADLMTISAHKIGGPQGVAALISRAGFDMKPLLRGGGQERNRRSGTENVAGIAGFGQAVEELDTDLSRQSTYVAWRDDFEEQVVANNGFVVGKNAPRIANTSCVLMPKVTAATQLMNFDLQGFAVSAGSACSSGKSKASGVLTAMGVDVDRAGTAIRASLGWQSQADDLAKFGSAWVDLAQRKSAAL